MLRCESQSALSCSAVDESNWLLLLSWRWKRKSFTSSETFTELSAPTGDVMNPDTRALHVTMCVAFPQEV